MPIAPSGPNAPQIEFWNSKAAEAWARNHATLDAMIEPLGEAAMSLASVRSGDRALDVGCGCGATSFALARLGAQVVGVDVSEPMLNVARERARGQPNGPSFLLADAATQEFQGDFSLLYSRFGVMFFLDPVAAFGNLRASLAPRGRLAFVCWRAALENPWITVPMAAVAPFVPPQPPAPPRAPGPFAFAEKDYVAGILAESGFREASIEPIDHLMSVGGSADMQTVLDFYLNIGPLASLLAGLDDSVREQAIEAARRAIEPHMSATGLRLAGGCWLVTARA